MIDKKVTFSQTLDNMIGNRLISRKNSNHHMRAVSIIIKLFKLQAFQISIFTPLYTNFFFLCYILVKNVVVQDFHQFSTIGR